MAKWVLHVENLNEVDPKALLRKLAEDVARDAERLAPKRTGRLAKSIHVAEVTDSHAIVQADPRNPDASAGNEPYAGYVERGTSDTPAQPYLRPATYRYRS